MVYRLLNLIKPKNLYLGEKDWQQLLILKNLIKRKKLNVAIKSIPTQRDFDGIPLSCLLYTSPSPRDYAASRMPSSA